MQTRTERKTVLFTPNEWRQVKEHAEKSGLTPSSYIRMAVMRAIIYADHEEYQPRGEYGL